MFEPLPSFYFFFFWIVEPGLTIAGAAYAILDPQHYAEDLLPTGVERFTSIIGNTIRGQMVIGGLGSCFFLLAMISLSLFPLFKNQLNHLPAVQEKFVKGLLLPLAIADIIQFPSAIDSIIVTVLPLPWSLTSSPTRWTQLIYGNVLITAALFGVRVAWFLGIGRRVLSSEKEAAGPKVLTNRGKSVY